MSDMEVLCENSIVVFEIGKDPENTLKMAKEKSTCPKMSKEYPNYIGSLENDLFSFSIEKKVDKND